MTTLVILYINIKNIEKNKELLYNYCIVSNDTCTQFLLTINLV